MSQGNSSCLYNFNGRRLCNSEEGNQVFSSEMAYTPLVHSFEPSDSNISDIATLETRASRSTCTPRKQYY